VVATATEATAACRLAGRCPRACRIAFSATQAQAMPNASETQIVNSTVKEAKNVFIFFGTAAIILLCWSDSLCLKSGKKSGYTRPCTIGVIGCPEAKLTPCAFLDVKEPRLVYASNPRANGDFPPRHTLFCSLSN
jgi:hypothetical protein